MLFLVKDILDYSQLESNSLILNKSAVEISTIIDDCIGVLGFKAQEKGIQLVLKDSKALKLEIFTDSNRVK